MRGKGPCWAFGVGCSVFGSGSESAPSRFRRLDAALERLLEPLHVLVHLLLNHALDERANERDLDLVVDNALEGGPVLARKEAPGAAVLAEVAFHQLELAGAHLVVPVILLGPLD